MRRTTPRPGHRRRSRRASARGCCPPPECPSPRGSGRRQTGGISSAVPTPSPSATRLHQAGESAAVSPEVPPVRCEALAQRVRPAEPLTPGRDLGGVQIGIVAAVAADDLEHAGIAAFHSALNNADWLVPEERPGGLPVV